MSAADSTAPGDASKPAKPNTTPATPKPAKPYPTFPLFPHAAGVWAKKIRGKLHYFGPWNDPDGALKRYEEQKEGLHFGRRPRPNPEAVTVKDAANTFLNAKRDLVDAGELSPLTFNNYRRAADELVAHMGKIRLVADLDPSDFASLRNKMAKKWGPTRLAVVVQYIRSIFKHATETGLIEYVVRFGPQFKGPSRKVRRRHRAEQGKKMFMADEVRRLIAAADVQLRAMLLLGINCGFGNADCGRLPLSALDLDGGWLDFPRAKTGVPRRCPLWPETIQALQDVLARRREPKKPADAGLVFVTKFGAPWHKENGGRPVALGMNRLLKKLSINGRKGLGFYSLRHTFRTVADEAKDQPAVDHMMGHEVPHISSHYRETISDVRLKAVANHVHGWLFGGATAAAPAESVNTDKSRPESADGAASDDATQP
jgi:integrase